MQRPQAAGQDLDPQERAGLRRKQTVGRFARASPARVVAADFPLFSRSFTRPCAWMPLSSCVLYPLSSAASAPGHLVTAAVDDCGNTAIHFTLKAARETSEIG